MSQNKRVFEFVSEEFSVEYGKAVSRFNSSKKARILQQPAPERRSVSQSVIDLQTEQRLFSQADQESQSQEPQGSESQRKDQIEGSFFKISQFDGYPAEQPSFLDSINEEPISNPIQQSVRVTFFQLMSKFMPILLKTMNLRREERRNSRRNEKGSRFGRPNGRSLTTEKYQHLWGTPFSQNDLDCFLACYYRMCTIRASSLDDYWVTPTSDQCGHGQWFGARMSKRKYSEMFRCLDLDINQWLELLNQEFIGKKPITKLVSVDETMVPFRGRGNPHHIFIPRKPHPHGLKFETIADTDRYLFQLHLHRRTANEVTAPVLLNQKKQPLIRESMVEAPKETIVEVLKGLLFPLENKDHFVVADRYYGGLKELNAVSEMGMDVLFKCKKNRPTVLWNEIHSLQCGIDGYVFASCTTSEKQTQFYVYSRPDSNDNLISTIPFRGYVTKNFITLNKETKDREMAEIRLHESSDVYNTVSNYVDAANRSILECRYNHRKSNYKIAMLCFFFDLLAHNARVLHEYYTHKQYSQKEFLQELSNQLFDAQQTLAKDHKLERMDWKSGRNCPVCYFKGKSSRQRVFTSCSKCGVPMCEECFSLFVHQEFYERRTNRRNKQSAS